MFDGRASYIQRLAICAGAIAVGATACGAAPLVRDDIHLHEWYELRSAHIQLTTDLPVDRAQERVRDLEQSWRALIAMYVVIAPWATPPEEPFPVIHLSSCAEFREIAPEHSGGFVFSSSEFPGERVVVTCESGAWNHELFLHELVHILNYRCIPLAPVWVNEGLATYFETMSVAKGRAMIGKQPASKLRPLRGSNWFPGLAELLSIDAVEFYGDQYERNYVAAWKLVHLLNNTRPEYQNRFRGFLAMLNGERKRENAWAQAFHGLSSERLADEYRAYQRRPELRMWTTSYALENPPEASVRRLRAGEAHAVWAHLLSRQSPGAALRQLDLAARADPDWPDIFYWRARLLPRLNQHRADELATESLNEYRTRRPDDVRGWYAQLLADLRRVVPRDHLGLEETVPAGIEDLAPVAQGLVSHATRPTDLNLAAWYYAMARQADTGLPLAIQCVQRDPGCAECWDTLALLYFQQGDAARAVLAQERAVNMYGDRGIGSSAQSRLKRYRTAATADTR